MLAFAVDDDLNQWNLEAFADPLGQAALEPVGPGVGVDDEDEEVRTVEPEGILDRSRRIRVADPTLRRHAFAGEPVEAMSEPLPGVCAGTVSKSRRLSTVSLAMITIRFTFAPSARFGQRTSRA
jgi:hypothetical protein